ncbi:DUF4328 domain-containing protein [Demequina sp.]|uniref:DUF4328 domain-containing protein n=1 Tax=Demequina sp. TaxID=2050685 RepID=UPI003D09D9A3
MTATTDMYGNPTPVTRKIRSFGSEPTVAITGTGIATLAQVAFLTYAVLVERGVADTDQATWVVWLAVIVIGMLTGYGTLLRWMFAVRSRLLLAGYDSPAPWKLWAAWIIPIYNFWGPYKVFGAFRVRVRRPSAWAAPTWWTAWVVFLVVDRIYSRIPETNALTTGLLVLSIVAIVAAYAGLVVLIREISASFVPRPAQ